LREEWRVALHPQENWIFVVCGNAVAGLGYGQCEAAHILTWTTDQDSDSPILSFKLQSEPAPLNFQILDLRYADYNSDLPAHRTPVRLIFVAPKNRSQRPSAIWTRIGLFSSESLSGILPQ
jgi:hypothetical protein